MHLRPHTPMFLIGYSIFTMNTNHRLSRARYSQIATRRNIFNHDNGNITMKTFWKSRLPDTCIKYGNLELMKRKLMRIINCIQQGLGACLNLLNSIYIHLLSRKFPMNHSITSTLSLARITPIHIQYHLIFSLDKLVCSKKGSLYP